MTAWLFQSSASLARSCVLTYRSEDGLLGMQILSGGRKADQRVYFVWDAPDASLDYATEAEARTALQAQETR